MDRDSILHFAARCKIKSKIVEIHYNLSARPLDFDRFFVKLPNPSASGNSRPKPVPSRRPAAGLCFYALCVVRSPVGESTVNLRCPVAVNDRTGKAMQAILETGDYHMRHLLSEFGSGKGDGPC